MNIRKALGLSACAVVFSLAWHVSEADARSYKNKPNIIVIMADDLGQDSSDLYNEFTQDPDFPKTAPTPHLRDLAGNGLKFKNGWAMPSCSPTRGTRTMGKLPSTSGMSAVIAPPTTGRRHSVTDEEFPPTMVNPHDKNLLQKLLKKAGYKTYKLGKWHETNFDETTPAARAAQGLQDVLDSGFDSFYGLLSGSPPPGGINANGYGGIDTWTPVNNIGRNATFEWGDSALVSRALEFIDEAETSGHPYYISLDLVGPHFDYEVAPGPDEPRPVDMDPDDAWLTLDPVIHATVIDQVKAAFGGVYPPAGTRQPAPPANDQAQRRAAFKSLISYLDLQVGRLLQHVDLKETYVIFLGDNGTQGGPLFGNRFDVVEAPFDNLKSKATVYRNGVEVPFLAAGPTVRKKGRTTDALVTSTDLFATVLEMAGVRQPRETRRDSYSFMRVLKGLGAKRRYNVAETFATTHTVGGLANPSANDSRVVADKRFRLIARPVVEGGEYKCRADSAQMPADDCLNPVTGVYEKETVLEFYDLKHDPLENDALTLEEMNSRQFFGYLRLCSELNRVSKRARYFQNGKLCDDLGENLVDPNEGA